MKPTSHEEQRQSALEAMVEHIAYEIEMLQGTMGLIQSGRYPTSGGDDTQRILGNALLESMLVHARLLDDFFSAKARRAPDDVIALDFLPTWPRRTVLTKRQRDRVSKKVAHLTSARTAGPDPWELTASLAVLATCKEFLERLGREQSARAEWFKRWLAY